MRKQIFKALGLLALGLPGVGCSPLGSPPGPPTPPPYDPEWQTGDSWQIEYEIELRRNPKHDGSAGSSRLRETLVYEYRIVVETVENGRDVAKVNVTPTRAGFPQWSLTLDQNEDVLLSIEEMLPGGQSITTDNPFGADAWMPKLDQFYALLIHDFPHLPDPRVDERRTLDAPGSSTPSFEQDVRFLTDSAEITMRRTDPATAETHMTTIRWVPGKKWWTSAETVLGSEVRISGRLR